MADEEFHELDEKAVEEAVKYADKLLARAQMETSSPGVFGAAMFIVIKRMAQAQGVEPRAVFESMARDFRKPGEEDS